MKLQQYFDICNDSNTADVEKLYLTTIQEFYEIRCNIHLFEGEDNIQDLMKDLERRLAAAKKGLGLSNKLSGEARAKHNKRVMGNLNRIRAQLARLKKQTSK